VANGDIFYEHPAGMCDSEPDPWKVAVKEVEEETGLKITRDNLRLLHAEPLYSSAGLLDEAGYFFACDIPLSKEEIDTYRDKSSRSSQTKMKSSSLMSAHSRRYSVLSAIPTVFSQPICIWKM
jgi:hypothetical protein